MHYRLTSGYWIGQIIDQKTYSALFWEKQFLYEPVADLEGYEFEIRITNKVRNNKVTRHLFDWPKEINQFIKQSGYFSEHDSKYYRENLDQEDSIIIENDSTIIEYIRKQ